MAYAEATLAWAAEALELTDPEIGHAVKASRKTVQRWREQQSSPSEHHRRGLEKLNQLRYLLEAEFAPAAAQQWMHTPLPALHGRTPLAVLADGEIDRVLQILGTLAAGAFI
jgi:uncharacterized protein (DUF2384 family)